MIWLHNGDPGDIPPDFFCRIGIPLLTGFLYLVMTGNIPTLVVLINPLTIMKKSFFTLAIIAFCAVGSYGQGISGGLKLGANFANQKFSEDGFDFSPSSRTSLHGGFFLTLMVSETFGIQPELLYNSVG